MKNGYTITHCPNTPEVKAAVRAAKGNMKVRLKGRGKPEGWTWAQVAYGTPLKHATHFTAYFHGEQRGLNEYRRFRFLGLKDGRLHVERLNDQS